MAASTDDFRVAVRAALKAKGVNGRDLAAQEGFDKAHLSRVLNGTRIPTRWVMERVCAALELDPAKFALYRELAVVEAVQADAALRDRIFKTVRRDLKPAERPLARARDNKN